MSPVLSRADLILTSEVPGADEPKHEGDTQEITKTYSPASTFKLIIELAALESEVAAYNTVLPAADREKQSGKKELDGREAMFYSSNDYFLKLVEKMTPQIVMEMANRCAFGHAQGDNRDIMKAEPRDWAHGGKIIYISPAQQHAFMRQVAKKALPVKPVTLEGLMNTMEWPGRAGYRVFAKSGSFDKVYWFTGVAVKEGQPSKVITVLVTAKDGTRDQAIERFYALLGPATAGEPAVPQKPEPPSVPSPAPQKPQITPGAPTPLVPREPKETNAAPVKP
ncbi:MAG: penicillin-binding transpeptidase domain-containing protein [Candidatus Methylacidiphilales bacterium]|nr:penicillin-binding transpeptidase domain-containing protein [Candidatus Methylacidiphilales bacterium]